MPNFADVFSYIKNVRAYFSSLTFLVIFSLKKNLESVISKRGISQKISKGLIHNFSWNSVNLDFKHVLYIFSYFFDCIRTIQNVLLPLKKIKSRIRGKSKFETTKLIFTVISFHEDWFSRLSQILDVSVKLVPAKFMIFCYQRK